MIKKAFFALLSLCFLSAEAVETLVEPVADSSVFTRRAVSEPANDVRRAPAIPNGQWKNIGTGKWFDDLFSYYQVVAPGDVWDVVFEQSADNQAWYRVLPYGPGSPVAEMMGEDDTDNYVYINTSDPAKVYIPDFKAYGQYIFSQHVDENSWWDDADYGTLSDGIITFPANCFCHRIHEAGGPWSRVNTSGKMRIALPGAQTSDYALKVESPFCPDEEGNVRIRFTLGEDIATVKYSLVQGEYFAEGNNVNVVLSQGAVLKGTSLRATPHERSMFSLLVVALNREDEVVASTQCQFFGPDSADPDTWRTAGEASFSESFFMPIYQNLTAETLVVPYEESLEHPGRIRLVNPYSVHGFSPAIEHAHHHYLFIDASASSAVYVEPSAIGADFGGGESAVWSVAGRYVEYGLASEAYNLGLFGKRSGNVITMPDYSLLVGEKKYAGGSFAETGAGFRVSLRPAQSGIENIDASAAAAERYYTIDGKIIDGRPSTPGLYIVRTPAGPRKTIIR
ncbi:MAG: hypothetical protein K2M06_00625 [Muribaculaceae bacterium]|nr:hypothetical protein [Muribaculaceae bacterium]